MSFTKKVKTEILSNQIKKECCRRAILAGIIHSAGSITIDNGGMCLLISSENEGLIKFSADIITTEFNAQYNILTEKNNTINKNPLMSLIVKPNFSKEILEVLGILCKDNEGFNEIRYGIDPRVIELPCCEKSFISGLFLGCGVATIPDASVLKSSYHFEFRLSNEFLADDLCNLLSKHNFFPKKVVRKNNFVVYLKESEQLSDILVLMGANAQALYLQTIIVDRFMRNKINRESNCINANISKAVNASVAQIDAINFIEKTIGLGALNEKLLEIARVRLEFPFETSGELVKHLKNPIGKSGINHRLHKLITIAEDIKGGKGYEI